MWSRFAIACVVAMLARPCVAQVLWYGGDGISGGTFNNTSSADGSGTQRVLDDFVVPAGTQWHVTGLFSNNVAANPIATAPFTQAQWSIRTGVTASSFGTILYSGTSPVVITPTGRYPSLPSIGTEYNVLVSGLSIDLGPGTYFFNVTPVTASLKNYSVPGSSGTNRIGPISPFGFFTEFEQPSPPLHTIGTADIPSASLGVIGTSTGPPIPTLSSYTLALLLAAICIIGVISIRTA